MERYIVIFYSDKEEENPEIQRYTLAEIWEVIDRAKEKGIRIAVYEIGDCVLDWT